MGDANDLLELLSLPLTAVQAIRSRHAATARWRVTADGQTSGSVIARLAGSSP